MTVLEQLGERIADLLRADERRLLLGEDVADGTMLGLSRATVADAQLRSRVIATPLVPSTLAAHAAGLAVAGYRPLVVLPDAGTLLEGLAGLRDAAAWSSRNDGTPVPVCFVAPSGPGLGLGGVATEAPEAVLARVPGLQVLCAGHAEDMGAWFDAALDHAQAEGPTVLLLPRRLLLGAPSAPQAHDLGRSATAAHRVRDGAAATVFAWGESLGIALAAAAQSGVDAAVVDVGCLSPLPLDALTAEARATGKLVIVHAGPKVGGLGAELAAHFADAAILHLDAPIVRVTGAPAPCRAADEGAALPTVNDVAEAITRVASY